ncbi:lipoprotein insertase outer membrane protein LolB [Candidatus Thioglobus sp.]|jgi:outer membrane biogenesis lipoprotein LolB|uniref:lipoprotein insertase outer membrane protein LolB n=1 Tax=Candidatus Thioglobus sp. TaxID=2026721 RepID=UPI001D9E8316|nr:lipoprotein insertase outer membrane protein LolB [Candidatus Thioglobus sp.]MBT3276585.1 hypothetical protein [Candidatus Thioglobus sp.]MBT3446684.1 hypothetical protein [Candidatus Thioglobus sp.]MBT4001342.1 hypothetical protein [Candidatus Thioglobus sp.]MBT4182032.1 hypothetical protein [Candidatus Thioglobus sp.]MBT4422491.1 hypothetical protein [Candidatus Thioglobus sp.]
MKQLFTLCILLFLQGCETLNTQTHYSVPSIAPDAWSAKGRAGILVNGSNQNISFNISFVEQEFEMVLVSALGLGEVNVRSTEHGLFVDHVQTPLNLQQWMTQELGWNFPLHSLSDIIFKHRLDAQSEWQVQIGKFMPYQGSSIAKMVKLKHRNKPIKIKLLLQEVNQLK